MSLNDAQPNEESCVSHIDQELSYDERVVELNNYHFLCACVRWMQDEKLLWVPFVEGAHTSHAHWLDLMATEVL